MKIYKNLLSDGDSKAYIDVFSIFGVCELCEQYKKRVTNVADATFTEWV